MKKHVTLCSKICCCCLFGGDFCLVCFGWFCLVGCFFVCVVVGFGFAGFVCLL